MGNQSLASGQTRRKVGRHREERCLQKKIILKLNTFRKPVAIA